VYLPLAGRDGLRRCRDLAGRAQLALIAAPLVALALMVVAVSFRTRTAVAATAVSEVIVLATIAVRFSPGRDTFPAVSAVAGFLLMPAAAMAPEARALLPVPVLGGVVALLAAALALAMIRSLRQTTVAGVLAAVPVMIAAVGAGYLVAAVHG
jgi:hypothetical protein